MFGMMRSRRRSHGPSVPVAPVRPEVTRYLPEKSSREIGFHQGVLVTLCVCMMGVLGVLGIFWATRLEAPAQNVKVTPGQGMSMVSTGEIGINSAPLTTVVRLSDEEIPRRCELKNKLCRTVVPHDTSCFAAAEAGGKAVPTVTERVDNILTIRADVPDGTWVYFHCFR